MILLSALLASLTGLVAGERPVERAQVELSAVAAIVQRGEAATPVQLRPANPVPALVALGLVLLVTFRVLPARPLLARLSLKQSWLH